MTRMNSPRAMRSAVQSDIAVARVTRTASFGSMAFSPKKSLGEMSQWWPLSTGGDHRDLGAPAVQVEYGVGGISLGEEQLSSIHVEDPASQP